MNVLQVMGCESNQYASMERYLVHKADFARRQGHQLFVAYEGEPASERFVHDFSERGGVLLQLKCNGFLDWSFYGRLKKIIGENAIDVVHAYFTNTCHYAMIASFALGVRRRFRTSANLPSTLFKREREPNRISMKLFVMRQRILSWFPRKILCRSGSVADEFLAMGVPARKVVVVSGGTDTSKYRKEQADSCLRKKFGIKPGKRIVGTACRIVPVKGLDTFVKAGADLVQKRDDFQFLVVGDGPDLQRLVDLSSRLGVAKHFIFAGHQDDILPFLNMMEIFVLPSYSEGMSNSILEALACELPVIVSDIPPNREIFDAADSSECRIGEMFRVGDDKELSEKIERLIDREDLREMGRQCRNVVLRHFSIDRRVEKEFAVYDEN